MRSKNTGKIKLTSIILAIMMLHFVSSAAIEETYEDFVLIRIYPDDSATIYMKGKFNGGRSFLEGTSIFKELGLNLECSTEENVTTIKNELSIQFESESCNAPKDLFMNLKGRGNSTKGDLTVNISYPDVCVVNGNIRLASIKTNNDLRVDLDLLVKLYYSYSSKEEARMLTQAIPLMKTQISAELYKASGGYLSLDKLETQGYKEQPEYVQLTLSLCLSGDFQRGIQYLLDTMQSEIDVSYPLEEKWLLSLESYNYDITFEGDSLTLGAVSEVTVNGDFDEQLNGVKNDILQRFVDEEQLEKSSKELVSKMYLIDYNFQEVKLDLSLIEDESTFNSEVSVKGLGLKPGSINDFLYCLKNISNNGIMEGFKIIIEGASVSDQYVIVDIPKDMENSVIEKENKLVMDIDALTDLSEVTYSVKTEQSQMSTIITASAFGLLIIGVVTYFLVKK